MTKDEFSKLVDSLTQVRHWLYSNSAQQQVLNEPQAVRDQFVSFRREINFLETHLQIAELESISDKLDELGPQLTLALTALTHRSLPWPKSAPSLTLFQVLLALSLALSRSSELGATWSFNHWYLDG